MTNVLITLVLAVLIAQHFQTDRRLDGIWKLDAKLDAIIRNLGITVDKFAGVPKGVEEALERGETIVAIKRLREATGLSLAEARDYVEELKGVRGKG